jgi:hypothetical protein
MRHIARSALAALAAATALVSVIALAVALAPRPAVAGEAAAAPGVVSHVKVVSDKVPDISSLEAWRAAFIKDGMTDRDKALAVWRTVVMFQHQDGPPKEYLQLEDTVLDPLKLFNVYGYSFCSVATSHMLALARYAGLEGRGWSISAHCVPDVRWGDAWHMLDASLINYFPFPDAAGEPAGVEDIIAGVKEWYAAHPEYRKNDKRLREFMAAGGWRQGPAVLANSPFYDDNGWLPAATHGWYSTMQEYDGSTANVYESGYSVGYQVNVQLRRGERLVRRWSNKGLHINMDGGGTPGCLKATVGKDSLRYSPRYGDLAPGRVGNGTHEYAVPLADGGFRAGALAAQNLACRAEDPAGPALHARDASADGVLVLRMPSSYVYLGGTLAMEAVVGDGGSVAVAFSDNNGLDWRDVETVTASGKREIDLKALVFRRYDYRLRFTLKGKGTGLESLAVTHDVQHSQRALPALAMGANKIAFSAQPQEGTVTIEGSTDPNSRGKQLMYTDFHPVVEGVADDALRLTGPKGAVTFPVATPGPMTRLRVSVFYRARDAGDAWNVDASFDGGKTWRNMGRCQGPTRNHGRYFVLDDPPPDAREAQVRLSGEQRNTTMIYQTRIDADYREPAGGYRPITVTYEWDEAGQAKTDVHVAAGPEESYAITCGEKPVMKSLTVEWAE